MEQENANWNENEIFSCQQEIDIVNSWPFKDAVFQTEYLEKSNCTLAFFVSGILLIIELAPQQEFQKLKIVMKSKIRPSITARCFAPFWYRELLRIILKVNDERLRSLNNLKPPKQVSYIWSVAFDMEQNLTEHLVFYSSDVTKKD